jgi:hypothetical protein
LYPQELRPDIDELNDWVYNTVNSELWSESWLAYLTCSRWSLQMWFCDYSGGLWSKPDASVQVSR